MDVKIPAKDADVVVHIEGTDGRRQPDSFVFCAFGLQLYTERPFKALDPVELDITLGNNGSNPRTHKCLGLAIESVKAEEGSLYCTFVKFLDLPEAVKKQLFCHGGKTASLCDFCGGTLG
jgi:hypothetical protein